MSGGVAVPKLASSLILLSPGARKTAADGAFSVLMLKRCADTLCLCQVQAGQDVQRAQPSRHGKARFMPNQYVFPGGVLEKGDQPATWQSFLPQSLLSLPDVNFRVGGIRELYEESGVLLCHNQENKLDNTGKLNGSSGYVSGGDAVRYRQEVKETSNLFGVCRDQKWVPAVEDLLPWARWVTPMQVPLRYDTMFYLAVLNEHPHHAGHDQGETVDTVWGTPASLLASHHEGSFALPQATWFILRELARHRNMQALRDACLNMDMRPVTPHLDASKKSTITVIMPGDEAHPEQPGPSGKRWRIVTTDGINSEEISQP